MNALLKLCQINSSAQIRKLQAFLGAPLFQLLYRYAKNVIASADSAVRAMREDMAA